MYNRVPFQLDKEESDVNESSVYLGCTRRNSCDLDHELGILEVGKIADVLVVDGDPLEDIHDLTNTRLVIHNGVVIRDGGSRD